MSKSVKSCQKLLHVKIVKSCEELWQIAKNWQNFENNLKKKLKKSKTKWQKLKKKMKTIEKNWYQQWKNNFQIRPRKKFHLK